MPMKIDVLSVLAHSPGVIDHEENTCRSDNRGLVRCLGQAADFPKE
jgi:hypothetical protein